MESNFTFYSVLYKDYKKSVIFSIILVKLLERRIEIKMLFKVLKVILKAHIMTSFSLGVLIGFLIMFYPNADVEISEAWIKLLKCFGQGLISLFLLLQLIESNSSKTNDEENL